MRPGRKVTVVQTKKEKLEYQYFDLEHEDTKEILSLRIGPMPIHFRAFDALLKKAYKEKGRAFTKKWIIKKAWVGA